MRLLVIDDDPFVLDSMRMVLELDGHAVVQASSGTEGVETFRSAQESEKIFAAVITDLGMPQMNGNQVARRDKGDVACNARHPGDGLGTALAQRP